MQGTLHQKNRFGHIGVYVLPLLLLFAVNTVQAQLILTNGTPGVTIDFSNNMQVSVGSNPSQPFAGGGFEPNPTIAGRLNSNAWAFTGWSDGALNFGGARTTGGTDYTRGAAAAAVGTGGIYASRVAPGTVGNPILMFQPGGSDFEPGTVTLRILNNGTTIISQLAISYNLYVRNDQPRSNSFNLSWSTDNNTYTAVPAVDYATTEVADALGWVQVGTSPSRSTTLSGINFPPSTYLYLRWTCDAVSGSGSRDEIGLDDISVIATYDAPCSQPATQATVASFAAVGPYQMNVTVNRGNGTGGVVVVASTSPTLSADPQSGINYAMNTNFGNGDPVGGGFIVYRGAGNGVGLPFTITVTGLAPSTTYYYYVFEYNVTVPCVKTPGNTGSQLTAPGSATAPTDYFQTKASGNWNNTATWESSSVSAAGPWNPATAKPTSSSSGIKILNGFTVTISAPETAKLLTIDAGGTLTYANQAAGGYDLDFVDATGDDFIISGTYEIYGIAPGLVAPATCRVTPTGLIKANANNGSATSDDFARSPQIYLETNAVFEWNTTNTFSSNGLIYFPNAAATDIAIFRVSQSTGFPIGGGTSTTFNARFEANAPLLFQNAGVKIFRNGITGTGNITQGTSGQFQITGTAQLGGTGSIILSAGGMAITSTSVTTLISNKVVDNTGAGTFTVEGSGQLRTGSPTSYVISGTSTFVLAPAGIIYLGSAAGITTAPTAAGNIQTAVRTFDATATYYYYGQVNQATGNALPSTISGVGSIRISNNGAAGNNTVTLTNNNTITGLLYLNNGFFAAGAGQQLNISNNGNVYGQGGNQSQAVNEGYINFQGTGTVNPVVATHFLHNVRINGSIDFVGATANRTTITGTLEIRGGGFVAAGGKTPNYASAPASTLLYNCSCNYGAGQEWYPNNYGAVPGVPHNVTIAAGSSLNFGAENTPHEMRGDLSISSTSTFALSTVNGGDLYIKGNWTKASGGTFTPNQRAVKFNGTGGTQVITITGSGTETFAYFIVEKAAGQAVQLAGAPNATNVTLNGGGGGNTLQLINGDLDLNGRTFNFTSWFNSNQNNIGIDGTAGNLTRNITSSAGTGTFAVYHTDPATRTMSIGRMTGNASLLVVSSSVTVTTGAQLGGFGGMNFGNGLTTINGTLQINSYGFVNPFAPTYGTNSFLVYNASGIFDRNVEWGALSGAGYPFHVTVQNNTFLRLNFPNLNGDANRAIAGDLTISNGSTILQSTTNAGTLTVGRDFILNGTLIMPTVLGGDIYVGRNWNRNASTGLFIHNNRAVFFNSAANSTITANGDGQYFPYLYLTKSALSNTLSLLDNIRIGKEFGITTGTFDPATKDATLLSNDTTQASFGKVGAQGDVTYSGIGRFIVERYIKTGTAGGQHLKSWQFLAVPTNGGQTVNAAWQEGATFANQNLVPGYGTQITSNIAPLQPIFDALTTPASGPSMKTYNSAGAGSWVGIANTTTLPLYNPKGYMIFVRGDRSVTTFSGAGSTPVPTNLRSRGKLFVPGSNPPPSTTVPAGKFESIGNPYASTIDFLNITKPAAPAVDDVFYVWDPLLPGANNLNLGGYQTISLANSYWPSPGGTTNYPSGVPFTKIQSGQAFLVHSTSGGGTVSFTENAKSSGYNDVFRIPVSQQSSHFLRTVLYDGSGRLMDEVVVAFNNRYSNQYDASDALKMINGGASLGAVCEGKIVAIEARKPVMRRDTVHLTFSGLKQETYQFRFGPEHFPANGVEIFLADRYLGTRHAISSGDSTYINFDITGDPGSGSADRFILVFNKQNGPVRVNTIAETTKEKGKGKGEQVPVPGQGGINVYPNPVVNGNISIFFNGQPGGLYLVRLLNSMGQVVKEQTFAVTGENSLLILKANEALKGSHRLVITAADGTKTTRQVILQ